MSHLHSRYGRVAAAVACVMLMSCASRVSSFDDARIAEDVTGVLRADHIDGVSVYVKNGRVTLVGVVDTQEQSVQARRDAERVDGVASVTNDIETRKP